MFQKKADCWKLIEAMKNRPVTKADMEAFVERCRQRAVEDQEMVNSMQVTNEWLNREYNI